MSTKNSITIKVLVLMLTLSMFSCGSRKDIVYFQDEPISSEDFPKQNSFEIIYKADDLITINVSGLDPEAVKPFNLPAVTYDAMSSITTDLNTQGQRRMLTYLIDKEGNIEFPVIGTVKLGGLTRTEATVKMKTILSEYIKDPIVNIRLANFTISVLGEVNRPGTFTVQDERISIPEALGLAGDLSIYGKRDNIFLIREVDGQKKYAKIDLTSISVVNSPVYYLTQNDVIYVEPNKARIRQSSYNQNNGLVVSAIGTIATIIAILIR
ncbi:polysaccharide biosynthesis/export family protein [Ichthyenterobacterium sp. W332]|uniref:Polysaccharide biosynthesis/export family protein n=1 Tax=Microcosmobacter mediterraneus TaxID=3075607 RepID=A0ABU2YLK8_9FLAO|nr:polysaccharide biosynthesis/export family protein [Ichthyenterobacterium sp. W332]MDT0558722.1 polysaccharide biosynthesis/export family protein [Ichthyenterobacterium sp. W332]